VHELSIATALYDGCRAEIERGGGGGGVLSAVRVAVGERSGVEPQLLEVAWRAITDGGRDDGAELSIDWCPCEQTCAACGTIEQRQPGAWLRLCPSCESPLRVEGGDQLDITEIRFEPEEAVT
jgi:hydrogenase nickel incorporation protein HypA/HybF